MKKTKLPIDEKIQSYIAQYDSWLNELSPYITDRFATNYKSYTAYCETKGTKSKISDPVAPELTERLVQKYFERDPKFYTLARGHNISKEITDIISATASFFWTNPDMIQSTGTMRSKLKVAAREFNITGNTGIESYYNAESESPDMRVIPIEDVIFDPAKSLKTSKIYYVRQFVDMEYLEKHAEVMEKGKIVKGIFKNIDRVKYIYGDSTFQKDPSTNLIDRSGRTEIQSTVDPIELITRYEGKNVCRFIKGLNEEPGVGIQEFTNEVLADDPLDFCMDIEIPKQPYAMSYLDFIAPMTRAKDMLFNQAIDYGAKALNPPLFVDPSIMPINRKTLQNAYKLGGIVYANPQLADHKQMPPANQTGFQLMEYIQQRSEQVTGIGAYSSGVPNQTSDKTKGTKGGIEMMLNQAQSPIKDRQQNLEESLIEPCMTKWLKMAGSLMSENEIKYILMTGESKEWIRVTKGLLTGKITLKDLMMAGLIELEEAAEIAADMMEEGKDPTKDLVYDVDWIIRVEAGSLAEVDTEKEIDNFTTWAQAALAMGAQLDIQKVTEELARRTKIKDVSQYYIGGQNGGNQPKVNSPIGETAGIPGMVPQGGMPNNGPIGGGVSPIGQPIGGGAAVQTQAPAIA